jgi:hypothetical protein
MTNLTNEDVNFTFALYNLYATKASFQIEEYGMVHVVYSKIKKYLIEVKTHEGKESASEVKLELNLEDLQFTLNVLKVCSQRTATDIDEMVQLSTFYQKLKTIISENSSSADESSTELPRIEEVSA